MNNDFFNSIIKFTNSLYWNFISTLLALFIGVIATWFFSKKYFNKADINTREVNALLFQELKKIRGEESYIEYDDKTGKPKRVVTGKIKVSGGGSILVKGNKIIKQ
jgi:hypothetical protein